MTHVHACLHHVLETLRRQTNHKVHFRTSAQRMHVARLGLARAARRMMSSGVALERVRQGSDVLKNAALILSAAYGSVQAFESLSPYPYAHTHCVIDPEHRTFHASIRVGNAGYAPLHIKTIYFEATRTSTSTTSMLDDIDGFFLEDEAQKGSQSVTVNTGASAFVASGWWGWWPSSSKDASHSTSTSATTTHPSSSAASSVSKSDIAGRGSSARTTETAWINWHELHQFEYGQWDRTLKPQDALDLVQFVPDPDSRIFWHGSQVKADIATDLFCDWLARYYARIKDADLTVVVEYQLLNAFWNYLDDVTWVPRALVTWGRAAGRMRAKMHVADVPLPPMMQSTNRDITASSAAKSVDPVPGSARHA